MQFSEFLVKCSRLPGAYTGTWISKNSVDRELSSLVIFCRASSISFAATIHFHPTKPLGDFFAIKPNHLQAKKHG
jgi:hypothetical protein